MSNCDRNLIRGWSIAKSNNNLDKEAEIADNKRMNNHRNGFTLAEVLITLGIIGIVAALTIPNIVHGYRKKQIETRLASTNSILNQALKMAEADQGIITPDMPIDPNTIVETYFIPYLKVTNPVKPNTNQSNGYRYKLNNGVEVAYVIFGHNGGRLGIVQVDLNITNKEIQGVDTFMFAIANYNGKTRIAAGENYDPDRFNCSAVNGSYRATTIESCAKGEETDVGAGRWRVYCAALIECNGWKIPDDYPIRF